MQQVNGWIEAITIFPGSASIVVKLEDGRAHYLPDSATYRFRGVAVTREQFLEASVRATSRLTAILSFDGTPDAGGVVTSVEAIPEAAP